AHGAIFVTTGSYTPDAIEFARNKPIKLMDGREVVELLRRVQAKRQSSIENTTAAGRQVPTSVPVDDPGCPRCGSKMVRRLAKHGASAGSAFWGCSRFPTCRATRSV